jgi:hypothetical protein
MIAAAHKPVCFAIAWRPLTSNQSDQFINWRGYQANELESTTKPS